MFQVKLLGIAGSLRQKSTNRGLLRAAQSHLPDGASMDIADLGDIPFYNQDISAKPASVKKVFTNAFAGAFDADGNLTDAKLSQLVSAQMQALVSKAKALRG